MREETILNYQNLVYKILYHYRNLYNYNRDFEEDYFHDGMVALMQTYDTYKDGEYYGIVSDLPKDAKHKKSLCCFCNSFRNGDEIVFATNTL